MPVPKEVAEELLLEAKWELASIMQAAEESGSEFAAALEPIHQDAVEAIAHGDVEHVRELRHEISALLEAKRLELAGEAKQRAFALASRAFEALLAIAAHAANKLGVVLLCAILAGCGVFRQDALRTNGIEGLIGNVCRFDAECAALGVTQGAQDACDNLQGTDADPGLLAPTWANRAELAVPVGQLCAHIDGAVPRCLADRANVPEYRRRSLERWCGELRGLVGL